MRSVPPVECWPIDYGGPVDRSFEPFPGAALEASIVDRFEAIARRYAGRPAIADPIHSLNYAELAGLVARIAAATAQAVERPGPVAILLPRDVTFPAAMLGVLCAGRGYVPLDASHPTERNRIIATQSEAAAVISAGTLAGQARALFPRLPVVDVDAIGAVAKPLARPKPDDLAFIVYTSGSTGNPKGAYHSHRNLLHDVLQQTNTLHLDAEDRVALMYSPAVIAAIREIMLTLLNGAALHILPPNELQPNGLVREIEERGITILRSVPVMLRRLVECLAPDQRLNGIRVVGLGSQRVDWSDYDLFRRHFSPDAYLIVGIGATECGGNFAHWFVDGRMRDSGGRLPVGRVLPDAQLTIENSYGRPAIDGEVGEFVVASNYVALGYWRDTAATAQVFGSAPADPAMRIVRTGDVGRRRPDGLLEYVGRNDQMVKLRGHRIEIGEIEFALSACPDVEDAAVVVRRSRDGLPTSLAAYVEPTRGANNPAARDLLAALSRKLPSYMIPGSILVLAELPRLPTLKVDRVALAGLDAARLAQTAARPVDPLLAEVSKIFETVLETSGATPEDNVASLGGDSLQAVRIALALETRFGVTIAAGVFETMQTIQELTAWIAAQRSSHST